MKNAFDGFINRLYIAETKKMSDLGDMTIKTSKTEKEGGKKQKRKTRTKYP